MKRPLGNACCLGILAQTIYVPLLGLLLVLLGKDRHVCKQIVFADMGKKVLSRTRLFPKWKNGAEARHRTIKVNVGNAFARRSEQLVQTRVPLGAYD